MKPLPFNQRKNKFCSSSCAARVTNSTRNYSPSADKRTKKIKCLKCERELIVNIRCSKNVLCATCKKKFKVKHKTIKVKPIKTGSCIICGGVTNGSNKTCSVICKNYLISKKASERILKNGSTNFSTKQENFNYKFIKDMPCDSKLEMAGIIYLVDVFKAEKIERYTNILNFWEGDVHRTYNPDFFVIKDDKIYIVEVKMTWSKTSKHDYNRTIPLKKEALEKFCKNKNYEMLWLDYDYDKELRRIYNRVKRNNSQIH